MHIPDGFIDAPTSVGAAVVAVGGIAVSSETSGRGPRRATRPTGRAHRRVRLRGPDAQLPGGVSGTSGHLLGGVLAAVLVGPYVGALCVTVVLVVQALLFADGGLTALGLNVINMALVASFGGYAIFLAVRAVLPKRASSVVTASGIAAAIGVVLAAVAFTIEYAMGGSRWSVGLATVVGAMIGVHLLIGIGEGIITAMTVAAVLASRPDLVWGARDLEPQTPVGLDAAGVGG